MKKKVIIIEDDPDGAELLRHYLSSHTRHLQLEGCAGNCREGIELIGTTGPDLVLMDVEMPDGTGFDILQNIGDNSFHCIVVTAFEKFAVPAFDAEALHFLCKPLGKTRFDMALLRFYQRCGLMIEKREEILPDELLSTHKMKIPRSYGYDIVEIKDIVRLEAKGSYTEIYFSSGRTLLVSRNLKVYEEVLGSRGFVRIQRSHLVNVSYIKSIRKGKKGVLVLNNNTHLYFSNTYRSEILRHFPA